MLLLLQAAQRYYNYAQEQLAAAASQETPGSMALFGLAKIATLAVGDKPRRAWNASDKP